MLVGAVEHEEKMEGELDGECEKVVLDTCDVLQSV